MNIPEFPNFVTISLEHKNMVIQSVPEYQYDISDLTFTNLFVWRKSHLTHISLWKGCLCFLIEHSGGDIYSLVPLGKYDPVEYVNIIFDYLSKQSKPYHLCAVPENIVQILDKAGFKTKYEPDNSDYVYLTDDLVNLRGKKYDGKRNKIKRCLNNYECKYAVLTKELVNQCIEMLEQWCNLRKKCQDQQALKDELKAAKEALINFETLELSCGIIFIDNKIQALSIGEKLLPDTGVVHFEKANPEIDGLYQVINQWFCKYSLNKFKYVNREQDLGDLGLRKSKQSYHPHHLVKKYVVLP